MKQDKTNPGNGLRGLIDELYALASRKIASVIQGVTGSAPIVITGTPGHPNVTISPATDLAAGSLSAADKTKLDALTPGGVTSVTGAAPITSTGGATPVIGITPATDIAPGSMSAADKTKLDSFTSGAPTATFQAFNVGSPAATTQSFATAAPIVVGPSHRLTWTTTVTVAQGAGGTTIAGEQIQAFATLDGVNQAGLDVEVEMSPTHITGIIVLTATVGGLTPGSSHTPGITMTNVTTPAHTFVQQDGQLTGYT